VKFDPLLAVMNPRQIPECIASLEALPIRRAWLQRYTEWQLQDVIASIVEDEFVEFTHLGIVSDDVVVSPEALAAVLDLARSREVATGYCRLDETHPLVNVTKRPVTEPEPSREAYHFYSYDEAQMQAREFRTGFVGFAVTFMPREAWRRFPFRVYGDEGRSYASDYSLSWRLGNASVPMWCARDGYVRHVKRTWNSLEDAADPALPERRMLIGEEPARVIVEGV
jgi:hypothetical protein